MSSRNFVRDTTPIYHRRRLGPDSRDTTGGNIPQAIPEPPMTLPAVPDGRLALGWSWNPDRGEWQLAQIAQADRATHMYVVGTTGAGKSKFLEFLVRQDLGRRGFLLVDPHGDLVEAVKGWIAVHVEKTADTELLERVISIDLTDPLDTVTLNPLERVPGISSAEQAMKLVGAFKRIWKDFWGPRLEDLLRNSLIALCEAGLTLLELPLLLSNDGFRERVLEKVFHPIALQYFRRFDSLAPRLRNEWTESTLNKVNAFLSDDRVRRLLASQKSSFNPREAIDNGHIVLANLNKGRLGDNADLLGSLLVVLFQVAVLSRADLPQSQRTPFFQYIDEFQSFASESFLEILAEARKYGLSLVMAHQNQDQLSRELREGVLANASIQVYFRLNRSDSERLAREGGFSTTGTEIKAVRLAPDRFDYDYHSQGQEWEDHVRELQTLPPRTCYISHKIQGG